MVQGLAGFREKMKDFQNQYIIIGGVACDLLMEDAGETFRATKDLDVVLIVEALTPEFGRALWEYIQEGEYQFLNRSTGKPHFYRFSKPKNTAYLAMLELFSRKTDSVSLPGDARITPLPMEEDISSLSAILLDDEYYNFLKDGYVIINDLPILTEYHLIPFKAKAWLDLTVRKLHGEDIDSKNIAKHKNDVFRMSRLLSSEKQIEVSETIMADIESFLTAMENEEVNLKQFGLGSQKKDVVLQRIRNAYILAK